MSGFGVSAIAFDLDGVLVNSTPIHTWAFQEVLRPLGITQFDYTRWAGMTTRQTIDKVLEESGIKCSENERVTLSTTKSVLARERMLREPVIVDGCRQLLEQLYGRFLLALASSASPDSVEFFLEKSQSRSLFSVVLNGSNVERSKPAPDIYALATKRLGVSRERVLVVEDAVSGVRAGRDAGCEVWAVLGTASADLLLSAGASRVLDSLRDVGRTILNDTD